MKYIVPGYHPKEVIKDYTVNSTAKQITIYYLNDHKETIPLSNQNIKQLDQKLIQQMTDYINEEKPQDMHDYYAQLLIQEEQFLELGTASFLAATAFYANPDAQAIFLIASFITYTTATVREIYRRLLLKRINDYQTKQFYMENQADLTTIIPPKDVDNHSLEHLKALVKRPFKRNN